MKIKFIAPIVALATAGLLTGCNPERLEIPQKGVVTMESYYQTDEDGGMYVDKVQRLHMRHTASYSTSAVTTCMPQAHSTVTMTSQPR